MEINPAKLVIDYSEKDVLRFPCVTAESTDGNATVNSHFGKVVLTEQTIAYGAEGTCVITNNLVAAGDAVLASVIAAADATPGVVSAVTTANTITVTVSNFHGTDVSCTGYTLAFLLLKA